MGKIFNISLDTVKKLNAKKDSNVIAPSQLTDKEEVILSSSLSLGLSNESDCEWEIEAEKIRFYDTVSKLEFGKVYSLPQIIASLTSGKDTVRDRDIPDPSKIIKALKYYSVLEGHSFSIRLNKAGDVTLKVFEQPFNALPFKVVAQKLSEHLARERKMFADKIRNNLTFTEETVTATRALIAQQAQSLRIADAEAVSKKINKA